LVVNIMASKREDKYNAMKKVCCIQGGFAEMSFLRVKMSI